jgi:hypothetical protein
MNRKQVELSLQDSRTRNEYQKPEVITFGSVAKLTLGGTGSVNDGCSGKAGKSNGSCNP